MNLHLSLRSKLLLTMLLMIIPILLGLVYFYRSEIGRRTSLILDSQLSDARTVGILVDTQFDQAFSLASMLSTDPTILTMDPAIVDPYLARVARSYPQYLDIEVFNAAGDSVGASVPYPPGTQRLNIANEVHFQRAMAENKPQISGVQASTRWGGRPIVVLTWPLPVSQGKPMGVSEVIFDMESLRLRLQAVGIAHGQAITLIDPTGHVALNTVQPGLALQYAGDIQPVQQALSGQTVQVAAYQSPIGDVRMGAWAPTPKYGWVVGVNQPRDAALAPVRAALLRVLLIFLGALLFGVFVALILVRFLTGSLRRLVRYTRALGRGDLNSRVRITSGDELQQLGDAFNQMAEQLMQREHDRDAVARAARALVEPMELQAVADAVVQQTMNAVGPRLAAVWLADVRNRRLHLISHRGMSQETVAEVQDISFDAPLNTARAASTGQVEELDEPRTLAADLQAARRIAEREGYHTIISIPLRSRNRLVGVMTTATVVAMTDRQRAILTTLADLFANAVEKARLHDELQEALHLREEFLTAASHELRTPVTTMKGFAQLLLRKRDLDPALVRRALETIDNQTDRISRLAGDLLEASALRRGFLRLQFERVNLADMANRVIGQTRMLIDPRIYRLELVRKAGPVVEGDREHLTEVFSNLLEGAMARSPDGGLIQVIVDTRDGEALVAVCDEGLAIQQERWPYVFEPFYQTFPAGMPGYRGVVGLGLYITHEIVQRHGGKIWFESEEGKGSIFCFTLPLAK